MILKGHDTESPILERLVSMLECTEHILERYAERIQDKKGKTEIKSFVAQNRDRIKDNIQKLFDSSEYLCGQKIKEHNFTHFYVNKDGWVLITDKDKNKLITLYKVDLNLGSELNKLYIEKMITDIKGKINDLDNLELYIINHKEINKTEKEANDAEIKELKEKIKFLEETNTLYAQKEKQMDAEFQVEQRKLFNQIEGFIGARVFE